MSGGPSGRRGHGLSAQRLLAVARKESLQLGRDPRSLIMAFLYPALMIVFFGYVITFDIRDIKVAVFDQDHTQASRELVQAFEAAGYFQITGRLTRYQQIQPLLDRGAVRLALVIPPEFQRDLSAGRPAPVQALVDGADANTASIAINYADAIVTAYSARAVLHMARLRAPIVAQSRVWYNETLRISNMIVPGLVAVIMMIIAAMLTALTLAGAWERGTMGEMVATQVHRVEWVLG